MTCQAPGAACNGAPPASCSCSCLCALADTLHANLLEVKELFEVKRFALFDQVGGCCRFAGGRGCASLRHARGGATPPTSAARVALPQFPYTHHVECGVYLQRREQADGQQQQQQQQQGQQPAAEAAAAGEDGGRAAKRKAEADPAA